MNPAFRCVRSPTEFPVTAPPQGLPSQSDFVNLTTVVFRTTTNMKYSCPPSSHGAHRRCSFHPEPLMLYPAPPTRPSTLMRMQCSDYVDVLEHLPPASRSQSCYSLTQRYICSLSEDVPSLPSRLRTSPPRHSRAGIYSSHDSHQACSASGSPLLRLRVRATWTRTW